MVRCSTGFSLRGAGRSESTRDMPAPPRIHHGHSHGNRPTLADGRQDADPVPPPVQTAFDGMAYALGVSDKFQVRASRTWRAAAPGAPRARDYVAV